MSDTQTLAVSVQLPQAAELQKRGDAALAMVEQFQVTDDSSYALAAEELQAIQKREKELNEKRLAITRPMDEAKAQVMDLFRGPVELLGKAAGILKGKMVTYSTEQQRKAAEERARAEQAAQAERERLEAEAAKLREEGRAGEAAIKEQVATMVVAPPPAAAPAPKVAGIATRTTVEYEVRDLGKLLAFIVTGNGDTPLARPDLVGLVAADSVKLRAQVKATGMQTNLPGIHVFNKASIAASRK